MRLDAEARARLAERLRMARLAADLTQEQVADHLGVARPTISAIEKGDRQVRPQELAQFAALYRVKANALLRGEAVHVEFTPQFRRATGVRDDAAEGVAAMQALRSLAQSCVELERRLDRPLRADYPRTFPFDTGDVETSAVDAAMFFRERLGIGSSPIIDLATLVESELGVRVFVHPLPSRISGLYASSKDTGACVVLNAKHRAPRRTWTLAHELGHFMSTREATEVNDHVGLGKSPEERFADTFASELLLPSRSLRACCEDLRRGTGRLSPRDILFMARQFRVSYEAMCRRLESLRLIRAGTWEVWKQQGLTLEKIDDALGRESQGDLLPTRLLSLATEAYAREWISESQFADFIGVDRVSARELLDRYASEDLAQLEAVSG